MSVLDRKTHQTDKKKTQRADRRKTKQNKKKTKVETDQYTGSQSHTARGMNSKQKETQINRYRAGLRVQTGLHVGQLLILCY